VTGGQQKRCGPKNGTKNPRLQEARRLRSKGKTDADLLALGYTRNEIARSFVPNSVAKHGRCRANGCWAILNEDRVCMACELVAKIKREGLQEPEVYEPVKKGRPPIVRPLNMDHPAIIRSKN
jgi:hypothetical protein